MANNEEKMILVPESLLKAVAHVGVDFGYGSYELSKEEIQQARDILEGASDE